MCVLRITIIIRMMEVIKLASSTEFATKIQKVSNFCTEVIHFKLEALSYTVLLPVVVMSHSHQRKLDSFFSQSV